MLDADVIADVGADVDADDADADDADADAAAYTHQYHEGHLRAAVGYSGIEG